MFVTYTRLALSRTRGRILGSEARENYLAKSYSSNTWKTCPKERRVIRQMSKNSVNLDPDSSDGSRISSNDSAAPETKSWESNRIILYEPETNTEGNANITVLFYEITERVEFWSFKKTQNKRRHNEKGLMFLCLSCQDINSDTMFLLMRKITACFHAVNTETVSIW